MYCMVLVLYMHDEISSVAQSVTVKANEQGHIECNVLYCIAINNVLADQYFAQCCTLARLQAHVVVDPHQSNSESYS